MEFDYDQFSAWYDAQSGRWFTALENVHKSLSSYLTREVQEPDRSRLRVSAGRVKSKARLWKKCALDKYSDALNSLEDIERQIDDIVGIRLIGTNLADAERAKSIVHQLSHHEDGDPNPVLVLERDSDKDYWEVPKPSGYRAYHINLVTSVIVATHRVPVRCELQIRTLLQDSWGELTHEDTYKPGSAVPPLVGMLSRRMAELLSTLDYMADDLHQELVDVTERTVERVPEVGGGHSGPQTAFVSPETEALVKVEEPAVATYLRNLYEELGKPLDLASIAWRLQQEFGTELSASWLGRGSFKELLMALLPDADVTDAPPSYLLPSGFESEEVSDAGTSDSGIPSIPKRLKQIDSRFPLQTTDSWRATFGLACRSMLSVRPTSTADIQYVNELSRRARDLADQSPHSLSRSLFDFVFKALLFSGQLRTTPMTSREIAHAFAESVVQRAQSFGIPTGEQEVDDFKGWLDLL